MNIRKRLEHLSYISAKDRQLGRTTAICNAALDVGGIVVAHNLDFAKYLQNQFKGLVVKSMETNLEGLHGPFFYDHHAVEMILMKAVNKIDSLESENAKLKNQLRRIREISEEV